MGANSFSPRNSTFQIRFTAAINLWPNGCIETKWNQRIKINFSHVRRIPSVTCATFGRLAKRSKEKKNTRALDVKTESHIDGGSKFTHFDWGNCVTRLWLTVLSIARRLERVEWRCHTKMAISMPLKVWLIDITTPCGSPLQIQSLFTHVQIQDERGTRQNDGSMRNFAAAWKKWRKRRASGAACNGNAKWQSIYLHLLSATTIWMFEIQGSWDFEVEVAGTVLPMLYNKMKRATLRPFWLSFWSNWNGADA